MVARADSTPPHSGGALLVDDVIGRTLRPDTGQSEYLLESRLGRGGTAATYLARRSIAGGDSPAVIKVILPEIVDSQGSVASMLFLKEVVALGRLNERVPPSPFVVRLLDVGRVAFPWRNGDMDVPWLALEYVSGGAEGSTLRERVSRAIELTGYAFDRVRAERVLRHVSEGLAEAHEVGVIHRDLTPANVLCCNAGSEEMFKLSDFGIARPLGVDATFGSAVVGTPAYMAPEQIAEGTVGVASDVFSLACLTYFVLTGEEYFPAANAVENLELALRADRPKLVHSRALCPELREDGEACAQLDDCLARATSRDPSQRPSSARLFAGAALPSLHEASRQGSARYLSILGLQVATGSSSKVDWVVRHPPANDLTITSAGWDGDGHCLVVTTDGLRFWDGAVWVNPGLEDLGLRTPPSFARRVDAGRWLIGKGSALFEYSREGVNRFIRGKRPDQVFLEASGSIDDLVVVVAQAANEPPSLLALTGGRWLRPLPLPEVSVINGVTRLDDESWLLVGRSVQGHGFVHVYTPLDWAIEPLQAPSTRAYLACAARLERDVLVAVGTDGTIVRRERRVVSTTQLDGRPDLACIAIDVHDREWVGTAGALWCSSAGAEWTRVWSDPTWSSPFVSIYADGASVMALSVDGGVIECRPLASAVPRRA
ncbi:MAG TPA: serine/threonine-protein kinase [Polyangiaceae bacterium]|nr:serine/threonine-protein kinase [Polyangiaceae bacterium]